MTAVLACMWSADFFADVREEVERGAALCRGVCLWGCEVGITFITASEETAVLQLLSAGHFASIALSTLMKSLSRGVIDQDKSPVERCDRAARPSVKAIAGPLQEW